MDVYHSFPAYSNCVTVYAGIRQALPTLLVSSLGFFFFKKKEKKIKVKIRILKCDEEDGVLHTVIKQQKRRRRRKKKNKKEDKIIISDSPLIKH